MSEKLGLELPKGASDKVVQTGKNIVQKYDKQTLEKVAKLHFTPLSGGVAGQTRT